MVVGSGHGQPDGDAVPFRQQAATPAALAAVGGIGSDAFPTQGGFGNGPIPCSATASQYSGVRPTARPSLPQSREDVCGNPFLEAVMGVDLAHNSSGLGLPTGSQGAGHKSWHRDTSWSVGPSVLAVILPTVS